MTPRAFVIDHLSRIGRRCSLPVIDCDCSDDRIAVCKFRTGARDGLLVYREQCQRCGRKAGRKLDPFNLPSGISPKAVRWAIQRKMKKRPNSMQRRRAAKRSSSDFQDQRQRVMERDNWTCQGCPEEDVDLLEVHHVSYPEIPEDDVPDSELQTLCGPCNMAERNERLGGGKGGRVGAAI